VTSFQHGGTTSNESTGMRSFDIEASWNDQWISLNDHLRFIVGAESLGDKTVARRRTTVTSPFYDGEYEVHSVRENVRESLQVYVLGPSQSQLTEHILLLEDIFEQFVYNIRVTLDEHREVWTCQSADWSVDRSHVQAHNNRAVFKVEVPRLPKVSYEVIF